MNVPPTLVRDEECRGGHPYCGDWFNEIRSLTMPTLVGGYKRDDIVGSANNYDP